MRPARRALPSAVEAEFAGRVQFSQSIHELAPEHLAENSTGRKKPLRVNPSCSGRARTAGWDHTMDMRMMLEFLVPGMQHAEETDFSAEMLRVACDLEQRLGAGPEQQGIDLAFVLQRQRRKLVAAA